MTVFAKKNMNVSKWAAVQDRVGQLQISLGGPHDLMMLSSDSGELGIETIYIGLPTASLLPLFEGFEVIQQSELPDYLTTLVCREDEFAERFPDIAKKRRSRMAEWRSVSRHSIEPARYAALTRPTKPLPPSLPLAYLSASP